MSHWRVRFTESALLVMLVASCEVAPDRDVRRQEAVCRFEVGGEIETSDSRDTAALLAISTYAQFAGAAVGAATDVCRDLALDLGFAGNTVELDEAPSVNERLDLWCAAAATTIEERELAAGGAVTASISEPACVQGTEGVGECLKLCSRAEQCDAATTPPTCDGEVVEEECSRSCSVVGATGAQCEPVQIVLSWTEGVDPTVIADVEPRLKAGLGAAALLEAQITVVGLAFVELVGSEPLFTPGVDGECLGAATDAITSGVASIEAVTPAIDRVFIAVSAGQ